MPDVVSDLPTPWVSAWRDAVSACPTPVGLVDLAAVCILELSAPAAAVLGLTPEQARGFDYSALAERPDEARMFTLLGRDGYYDALDGVRQFPGPAGSTIEMRSFGRVIALGASRDMGLWILGDTEALVFAGERAPAPTAPEAIDMPVGTLVLAIVSDRWEVASNEVEPAYADWVQPPGAPVTDLTHPLDAAMLLLALAAATTSDVASARLRWRIGAEWRPVVLEVHQCPSEPLPRFQLALRHRLSHSGVPVDVDALASLGELPVRQREVLMRLVRGERVGQIAREMYLSESTVRNHLVAIFRKAGVHSQQELLNSLRAIDEVDLAVHPGEERKK